MNRQNKIQILHDAFNNEKPEAIKALTSKFDKVQIQRLLKMRPEQMTTEELAISIEFETGMPHVRLDMTCDEIRTEIKRLEENKL